MVRNVIESGDRSAVESDTLAAKEAEKWGLRVAREIVDEYGDAAALDTACYRICSFVQAAAQLALLDRSVARIIGASMESPREMDR